MSGVFDDPKRVFVVSLCEGARSWRNSALSPWNLALAITFAFLSVLCAIAFTLWPDATIGFFNAFTDGLDLNKTRTTTPISLGSVLYGVIGLGIVGFVAGVVFASVYNAFSQR